MPGLVENTDAAGGASLGDRARCAAMSAPRQVVRRVSCVGWLGARLRVELCGPGRGRPAPANHGRNDRCHGEGCEDPDRHGGLRGYPAGADHSEDARRARRLESCADRDGEPGDRAQRQYEVGPNREPAVLRNMNRQALAERWLLARRSRQRLRHATDVAWALATTNPFRRQPGPISRPGQSRRALEPMVRVWCAGRHRPSGRFPQPPGVRVPLASSWRGDRRAG